MLVIDFHRVIVAANRAGEPLFGRPAGALVGMPWRTVLDDPAEAVDDRAWRAALLAGESFGRRRVRRPDGSARIIEFAARPFRVRRRTLVLGVCLAATPERASPPGHHPAPLTDREREITRLIAYGRVTREICAELHVAPDTVRSHVRKAMAKTGAHTRAQLIAIAMGDGLLDP